MNLDMEIQQVQAQNPVVQHDGDVSKAAAIIKGIKGLIDKVKESYDPVIERAHAAHKEAIAQRDKYLKPLMETKKKYEVAITQYGLEKEAEQRRIEREANERLAKVAEEERLALLARAEKSGDDWEKVVLVEKAQAIVPITVETQKKVVEEKGVVIRKTWKARVIDEALIPRQYLEVDMYALNQVAKIEGVRKAGVPGVEFFEEASTSVRG